MDWLTAILAFATTMLILSMIVTTLVETVHRIFATRAKGLWNMMEKFYTTTIEPHLTARKVTTLDKDTFLKVMTENRITDGTPSAEPGANVSGNNLNHLPLEMFMERLGTTGFADVFSEPEAGSGLSKLTSKEAENIRLDIAQKFENYGLDASLRFEQLSRSLALFLSFAVAIVFYVHPQILLSTYLKNPQIAERIAIRSDAALDELKEIGAKIAVVNAASGDSNQSGESVEKVNKALSDLKATIDKVNDKVTLLQEDGAPLSWPDKWLELGFWEQAIAVFWLVLGALLVGLGAPFWAQTVTSLLKVRDVSKNVGQVLGAGKRIVATGGATAMIETVDVNVPSAPTATSSISTTAFAVSAANKELTSD